MPTIAAVVPLTPCRSSGSQRRIRASRMAPYWVVLGNLRFFSAVSCLENHRSGCLDISVRDHCNQHQYVAFTQCPTHPGDSEPKDSPTVHHTTTNPSGPSGRTSLKHRTARPHEVLHDFFGYRPSNGDLDDQRRWNSPRVGRWWVESTSTWSTQLTCV